MQLEMLTGRMTLEDFYGPGGYLETVQGYPRDDAMLALVHALRLVPSDLCAFGMTHMHQLGLRARDEEGAPELIKVMASHDVGYLIEYQMPDDEAPWPYAWVKGDTWSVDEARDMVLTAMRRSGGW